MKSKLVKPTLLGFIFFVAATACERKPVPKVAFEDSSLPKTSMNRSA